MNLENKFNDWFYNEDYPVEGQNRSGYMRDWADMKTISVRDYWMREAFMYGARAQLDLIVDAEIKQILESKPK
jgi:hypothetical protein